MFFWPGLKREVQKFVSECVVYQRSKSDKCHPPGLLEPLLILDMAWTYISMDFVEGLPKSNGKEVILVIIDRLTKYGHFIPLVHPYTAQLVAQAFLENVFKLHGMPKAIVTDRDRIFTSRFWQEIFKAWKVSLRFSTAYHPQSDGQTERLNQCLKSYLRCMAFTEPRRWYYWLALAEWWYNTTYHSSLKTTPYQALYGSPPPVISEVSVPGRDNEEATYFLLEKEGILKQIKENLAQAQLRMKKYADQNRSERTFEVGDMVYLKMQPYRLAAFGLRQSLKLTCKFYGSFRILQKLERWHTGCSFFQLE